MMRRRFLALLAVVSGRQRELSLHEADFYKPHDLAG